MKKGLAKFMGLVAMLAAFATVAADSAKRKLVYRPPAGAEEGVRVNGTSRGVDASLPSLLVLAPDHVGLTLREQPDLFWFQSKDTDIRFKLTMVADGVVEPVLEVNTPKQPSTTGIKRINLREHEVALQADVEYQWSVALVVDPKNPSKDIVASGYIRRTDPSPRLTAKLVKTNKRQLADVFAESGIWYDAIEEISDLVDSNPTNSDLRELRAMLLEQVDLVEPADFDRR
jgi:hypothetical protein